MRCGRSTIHAIARPVRRRCPEGRYDRTARRAGRAPRAAHVAGEGAEVLPLRRAAPPKQGGPGTIQPAPVGVAPRPLRGPLRVRPAGRSRARARPSTSGAGPPASRIARRSARSSSRSSATRWTTPTRTGPTSGPTASSRWVTSSRPCDLEPERAAAGWAPFWRYRGLGRYGQQIEHLLTLFPSDQVHVLRHANLVDDPADTLTRIAKVPRDRPRGLRRPEGAVENVSTWVSRRRSTRCSGGACAPGRGSASSRRPSRGGPPAGRS